MKSQGLRKWIGAAAFAAVASLVGADAGAKPLVVVQIGPIAEHAVPEVVQLGEGMQALFAAVNASGGVRGNLIDFVQLDDGGDPLRFIQQFGVATRRDALAVLSPFGSPTVHALLKSGVLDRAETAVINAVPGAEAFRKPGHLKLFHLRAGDGQQIDRLVDHARTMDVSRMAVLYNDTPGGYSELASTQEAARRVGGLEVIGLKSDLQRASIAEAARQVVASKTEAALVLGPPGFLTDAVSALREAGFSRAVFALSYLDPHTLAVLGPGPSRGIGIAQAFPNPMGLATPLQREFRSAMKTTYPNLKRYTAFHLEGYVSAKLFVEASRAARRLTALDIVRSLHAMRNTDLGGFRVDFSRTNAGSRYVDIAVVNESGQLIY